MAGHVDELVAAINKIVDTALPGATNAGRRLELAAALGDFAASMLAIAASRAADATSRRPD